MICTDRGLSTLDDQLAQAYGATTALVPRSDRLQVQQRDWIRNTRDKATNPEAIRTAYQSRISDLHSEADRAGALRVAIDAATLHQRCIPLRQEPDETCEVDDAGRADMRIPLAYQVQSYCTDDTRTAGGVVVLQDLGAGKLMPILWDAAEQAHYEKPESVRSPAGELLDIPGHIEGTGNFSAESLYRQVEGRWRAIDIESWQKALAARLPKGLGAWKGLFPDWRTMTVETPLWREGDGNCCPSGGIAHVGLTLQGNRIALTGLRVSIGN